MTRPHVLIIGGGASGVLMAAHLLRDPGADVHVTLIEKRGEVGRGVAYSARQQDHVLNVAAPGMSAFADDPDHFWRWLVERGFVEQANRFVFMPRRLYGEYLSWVLGKYIDDGRLRLLHDTVLAVHPLPGGVELSLDSGTSVVGHTAVLAVGHEERAARAKGIAVRVGSAQDTPLDPDADVMILGSGLSMVDAWLELSQADHRGPITVLSRHGLLPKRHCDVPRMELDAADVPFGTELGYFADWFRKTVEEHVGRGGNWRGAVDALRPFNQRIWQEWSTQSRRRFLEHVRPFWNIHRHRLPPELHDRLRAAVDSGRVRLVAGKFLDIARAGDRVRARVRLKGCAAEEFMEFARVYDCGGVSVDVLQSSNPAVQSLISSGAAKPDELHIGLDVTRDCAVIDANGVASARLFAVGPLTRGTFFEIEAIPDIRMQVAGLAKRLVC